MTGSTGGIERGVRDYFARGDVIIGGGRPWDVRVHRPTFYTRVAANGSLGLGESYMQGDWDCDAIDELVRRMALVPKSRRPSLQRVVSFAKHRWMNLQTRRRAHAVVDAHYDLGNEMFSTWLDPWMQYSCAYWEDGDDLEAAQQRKLALICRKLHLEPGERVLEIGCGWGGLARYMAKHHGVHVTAVNISSEQVRHARTWCAGLEVDVQHIDYREIRGTFDKIVSIAMFEAVGPSNYDVYMETVARCLEPDGAFLLHTIGENVTRIHGDQWILKYIFPNGHIPSIAQIGSALEGRFVMEDWHNLSTNYDKTLMAWSERFERSWDDIRARMPRFDERFRRMWRYYLLTCAGSFRARNLQLWQIVATRSRSGTPWAPMRS